MDLRRNEFERRQMKAARQELDQDYEVRNGPLSLSKCDTAGRLPGS